MKYYNVKWNFTNAVFTLLIGLTFAATVTAPLSAAEQKDPPIEIGDPPTVALSYLWLPIVAGGTTPEDRSSGDGTCLFRRNHNEIWIDVLVWSMDTLYVVSSSEREDEPYTVPMSPHSVHIGEVDSNGESITAYTQQYIGDGQFVKTIRCDAQFGYIE